MGQVAKRELEGRYRWLMMNEEDGLEICQTKGGSRGRPAQKVDAILSEEPTKVTMCSPG